ncbi:hypothetical protein OW763_00545 [Clostridium aestuarii]|uniref:Uncharacterized protein n=1 Tax=Clostridium aestuarii TaxID=338193 RepID=A0ABT4CV48_9CLOT|nr:hypothetical protein [Clostridium aestuarii]MCY6482841.1 hypothetical protein [Clostridium aestuarii]
MEKKYMSVKDSMLKFQLEQLGAEVCNIKGPLCYIKFTIDDTKFRYLYHINRKNKYFLERISPYSMPIANFNSEENIVNSIKTDIDKFKNAKNSKKFEEFISTNKNLVHIAKTFEKIYLHYNVSKYDLKDINAEIYNIKNKLESIIKTNEVVYDIDEDIEIY